MRQADSWIFSCTHCPLLGPKHVRARCFYIFQLRAVDGAELLPLFVDTCHLQYKRLGIVVCPRNLQSMVPFYLVFGFLSVLGAAAVTFVYLYVVDPLRYLAMRWLLAPTCCDSRRE